MNYFKINYGTDDDNYDIILCNNELKQFNSFIKDIQNVFQTKLRSFFQSKKAINFSTFDWVEFAKQDFIKLGYKKVNINSVVLNCSFLDKYNNIPLSADEDLITNGTDDKSALSIFEFSIFSEFEPGNTFSSYFFHNEKELGNFNSEIVNYIKLNPVIYNYEIVLYLESLEIYMSSIGYKIINPLSYKILCNHNLEKIPNQWKEILGNELYSTIISIVKPIVKNDSDNKEFEDELPF